MSTRTCPEHTGTTTALTSVSHALLFPQARRCRDEWSPSLAPSRTRGSLDRCVATIANILSDTGWGVLENYEVVRKIGPSALPLIRHARDVPELGD